MESNDSRSLDWKICFKKILAPHLLKPSISGEEKNNEIEAHRTFQNLQSDRLRATTLQNYLTRAESKQKAIPLPTRKESIQTNKNNQPSFNILCPDRKIQFPDEKLNNFENPAEIEENIESIIAAHAEEMAMNLKAFKVSKKNKYFYKTESSRFAPDWNSAMKKIFSPEAATDSSLKTTTLEPHQLEMGDSTLINPWTFHRLSREGFQKSDQMEESPLQFSSENSNGKRHYTKAEKNVLEVLRLSRSFKQRKKPHINIFDGAGVNCFKNDKI